MADSTYSVRTSFKPDALENARITESMGQVIAIGL